jgi:hypothetical protein
MKNLISLIISGALVVSGYAQTRNVLVGTNNAVVQPTNFWSADASNARAGLGLGTVATNPASAFQPSSTVLSNLSSSNAVNLTNIQATNITGTIAISNGGSGATTAGGARTNFGLGATWLTNTNVTNFRTAIGLGTNAQPVFGGASITGDLFAGSLEVAAGSNETAVTSDGIYFTGVAAATTRTNLGLGWSALTNSNAGTGLVSVNTNGVVVSPTNFWQVAPIVAQFIESQPTTNSTTNIVGARLLHIHSLDSPWVPNVTNMIVLPTNGTSFAGDIALVVHQGPTNTMTRVRQAGSTNDLITMTRFDEAVEFVYYENVWQLNHNVAFVEPIYFAGTNAAANAAASRTNLGLGATNTVDFNVINGLDRVVFSDSLTMLQVGSTPQGPRALIVRITNSEIGYFSVAGFTLNTPINFYTNTQADATRTNLGLGATWLTNTSVTNFRSAIELGATNDVTFADITLTESGEDDVSVENTSGSIVLRQTTNALVEFGTGASHLFYNAISFNNATNSSATRTNLGIPLAALTNTNAAGFQRAIFSTNASPTNSANVNGIGFNTAVAWMEVSVITNGVTNSYRIPLFQ